jgi:hypothetical protein
MRLKVSQDNLVKLVKATKARLDNQAQQVRLEILAQREQQEVQEQERLERQAVREHPEHLVRAVLVQLSKTSPANLDKPVRQDMIKVKSLEKKLRRIAHANS